MAYNNDYDPDSSPAERDVFKQTRFDTSGSSAASGSGGSAPSGDKKVGKALGKAGDSLAQGFQRSADTLNSMGDRMNRNSVPGPSTVDVRTAQLPSYRKGGKVRASGLALLHEGERVAGSRVPSTGVFNVRKGMRVVPNRSSNKNRR